MKDEDPYNSNARLNYVRNLKFQALKESNPLLNLPKKERLWLIDYAKLKEAFGKYYDDFPEAYKLTHNEEFPPLEDAYGIQFEGGVPAWVARGHAVNNVLLDIKNELNVLGVKWWELQDYESIGFTGCDRHPSEGCEGCKFVKDCDLKLKL